MLFNYPTFINTKEQTPSERLYNNLKLMVQTHVGEIWYDINFGTKIREVLCHEKRFNIWRILCKRRQFR